MAKINAINNKSEELTIDPGASGDSFVQFDINATGEFRIGVDDDDSDKFKISQGSALGSNDTFVMTAAGERTMPLQPAVLAELSAGASNVTGDGTTYTLTYDSEIFDQNNDLSSPTFTAPVTGRYLIVQNFSLTNSLTSSHTTLISNIVTSNRTYMGNYFDPYSYRDSSGTLSFNGVALADMDASDTASINFTISGGTKVVDLNTGSYVRNFLCVYLAC